MDIYIKHVLCVFIIPLYFDFTLAVSCKEYYYNIFTDTRYTDYMYCSTSCCGYTTSRYCCLYTYTKEYFSLGSTFAVIIGSVIGGIVGLILLCILIACICSKYNKTTRHGAVIQPHDETNIAMVSSSQLQQSGMHPGPASLPPLFPPQQQPFNQGGHPEPMPPPTYAESVISSQPPSQTKQ